MASLSTSLYKLMKILKKSPKDDITRKAVDYIIGERQASGMPLNAYKPIDEEEIKRIAKIIRSDDEIKTKNFKNVSRVQHENKGKLDADVNKFLAEHGYNKYGDFDVGEMGDDVMHNREDFMQALYDKFYQDLTKNQKNSPLYLEDEFTSNKLLQSLLMREKLLQYTKTKDPQIYQELATALHEYPTRNVDQRYKQVSDWLKRADAKYKEIVNPSGPKRQISYANQRYSNMDDPIQGDTFNEDFSMFDLEDYIQRENITNPYLKSYLEAELRKLNPKDAYDAEIIRQLEQKL